VAAPELLSAKRFETILSSISDGVFTVDAEWRLWCFNRAAEEITGFTRKEVLGRPCHEILRSNICRASCPLRYTMETDVPIVDMPITIQSRSGETIPASISTAVLRDTAGQIIGGVETFRDLRTVDKLRKEIEKRFAFEDIVSKNDRMQRLFDLLPTVAANDSTVLIEGESGTGKELFARAIHDLSPRQGHPFVVVNCGALPSTLLESELFGHRAGAFTGATRDRPGRVAMAEKGTLFLDEIGDMPLELQVKMLRVIQEKTYEPLGSDQPIKADIRIVAATNQTLRGLVEAKKFRQDLYYRIHVIRIQIPPLRDRMDDVPLLANHFLSRLTALRGKRVAGLSHAALKVLLSHRYPGNVRELQNVLEHAFVLCPGELIDVEDLPPEVRPPTGEPQDNSPMTLREIERRSIRQALERNQWNRLAAAKELGIHKTTLFRKLREHDFDLPPVDGRASKGTEEE